jgi:Holliday junction resolvase
MMEIEKSSRHQHIIGKFGEYMLCNWLSRSGFEVAIVDHTGLDIVAFNRKKKERIGITVKSRTRNIGKEATHVNIFSYREGKDNRQKLIDACVSFGCKPWIAVYVETAQSADLYLTSLSNYDSKYRIKERRAIDTWKMSRRCLVLYKQDEEVKHIKAGFTVEHWP